MNLRWLGHAAFALWHDRHAHARLCLDPHAPGVLGGRFSLPEIVGPFDAIVVTHGHEDHSAWRPALGTDTILDRSCRYGPYRLDFRGVPHDAYGGSRMGWVRMVSVSDGAHRVVHTGDIGSFSADDVAWLQDTDALLVPVGGTYTLDGAAAAALTRAVAPRWVIPMHGADPRVDLPLAPVSDFLDALRWQTVRAPQLSLPSPLASAQVVLLDHPAP